MKRFATTVAIAMILSTAINMAVITYLFAEEAVITAKVSDIQQKVDKRGEKFHRILVTETKTKDGISYTTTTAVTAFADKAPLVAKLAKGKDATMVVESHGYNGRTYYNLLGVK